MNIFKEEGLVAQHEVSIMVDISVDYKCANCGVIQSFTRDREGKWQPAMTCKVCGTRIFVKLRRTGHKILNAE
jgi:DNA-directed RNA polymerase subunit RPC12/RpoP|tara:strand:+ start:1622 stop:1840 length:219 start_codon:yes stop_codon:yes gene_type:complete